jgi:hypothetical protein
MNKTTVKAEPGKQELFIHRDFEAPCELVFNAFSDPKLLAQWLSPCGMTIHIEKLQPEGGSWRFIHSTPDGKTFGFHGVMLASGVENGTSEAHQLLDDLLAKLQPKPRPEAAR